MKTMYSPVRTLLRRTSSRQYHSVAVWPKLQVFMGPMASGKTNALLQQVDAARQHHEHVSIIKHEIDTRYVGIVRARTGLSLPADIVTPSLDDIDVVSGHFYAVDEGQFFGPSLMRLWDRIHACSSASLLVSGLDRDYRGQPFGEVLTLAETALKSHHSVVVHRLASQCTCGIGAEDVCRMPALLSQRLGAGGRDVVVIGSEDIYQPACLQHHSAEPIDAHHWSSGYYHQNMLR